MCKFNIKEKKRYNGYIRKKYYVELCYNGIYSNWLQVGEMNLDEYFFYKARFFSANIARLYVRENLANRDNFDKIEVAGKELLSNIYYQLNQTDSCCDDCFYVNCIKAQLKGYKLLSIVESTIFSEDELKLKIKDFPDYKSKKHPFNREKTYKKEIHRDTGEQDIVYREEDRVKDLYHEIITKPDGSIRKELIEKLTEHFGHGTAKRNNMN